MLADKVKSLIAETEAETKRTPYLEMAQNGLRTALEQLGNHAAQLDRQAKAEVASIAQAEKELAERKAKLAA